MPAPDRSRKPSRLMRIGRPAVNGAQRRRRIVTGATLLALVAVAIAALVAGPSGALQALAVAAGLGLAILLIMRNAMWREQQADLAELQRLKAQHETGEKMAALGLWTLDVEQRRLRFSAGAFRVFGIVASRGEPRLTEFVQAIHPDDRRRWTRTHRRALRKRTEVKIEYRYCDASGAERWLRSVARPVRNERTGSIRLEGTVQDISGMRAMQRQLAASEAKFRELTQLSSDWVWESDLQDRITYVSDSVDAVLGKWARSLVGRRRWESDLPDALPTDWSYLKTALAERRPFDGFEYTRIDDQGQLYHLSISGKPVFDERNVFSGYRGTGRNITREKQQRILLELDGDIAAIMREQTEADKVVTAVIITVCGKLGWLGGLRLVRSENRSRTREAWGYPEFSRIVRRLPATMATDDNSIEARVWETGKAIWVPNARREADFAARYGLRELGAQAAFVAPITDEHGAADSTLIFLAPVGFKSDKFLGEVAAVLSRSLSLYLQRTNAQARLRHASQHDALTGLPNRICIGERLDAMLRQKKPLAVVYVDLDRYKIINDTLGHSTGDKALIEVARRIASPLPDGDTAGRLGGDEFVALISSTANREQVENIARAMLAAIEKPLVLAGRAYFLSASIGIAMAPDDSQEGAQLIKAADAAMYQVKSEGRNDVRFFSGDLHDAERAEQLQLAAELPLAMQRNEVELFYQPVLDVGQRRVVSIEGLLRWRHPKLGLLRPERFLRVAEQSNLIREIGFWAIRRAIDDRIRLGLDQYDDIAVSVNISARQLAEEGFLDNLFELIEQTGFAPNLLRLELTESAFIENPDRTVSLIAELRRRGVRVIIDNFGTGYASLSYIKDLPVDGLKIDRAFVTDLPDNRGNAAIVQAVTTLAAKLGMQAMAEGVETAKEMRGLRQLQCDVMQGALICKPVAFAELREFLDSLPGLRRMHLVGSYKNDWTGPVADQPDGSKTGATTDRDAA